MDTRDAIHDYFSYEYNRLHVIGGIYLMAGHVTKRSAATRTDAVQVVLLIGSLKGKIVGRAGPNDNANKTL